MKTRIKTINKDQRHDDWEANEEGYIDGYVRGGTGEPLACVVLDNNRIVMIPLNCIVATGKFYS